MQVKSIKTREEKAILILKKGGVGVIPTDTIYGIVGSAFSKNAVAKIYKLKRRNPKKPLIVLIGSLVDLKKFGVWEKTDSAVKKRIRNLWPGKVSIIFPCASKKFSYLHRGTKTIAFRLPAKKWIRKILVKTGPLIAPSANTETHPPAKTINEARAYFGNRVDFYIDGGKVFSKPSTLIKIKKGGGIDTIRN